MLVRKSHGGGEEVGQTKAVKVTSFPSLFWEEFKGCLTKKSILSHLCIAVSWTADLMGIWQIEGWSNQYQTSPLIICQNFLNMKSYVHNVTLLFIVSLHLMPLSNDWLVEFFLQVGKYFSFLPLPQVFKFPLSLPTKSLCNSPDFTANTKEFRDIFLNYTWQLIQVASWAHRGIFHMICWHRHFSYKCT